MHTTKTAIVFDGVGTRRFTFDSVALGTLVAVVFDGVGTGHIIVTAVMAGETLTHTFSFDSIEPTSLDVADVTMFVPASSIST
jgi:hypothetical protein